MLVAAGAGTLLLIGRAVVRRDRAREAEVETRWQAQVESVASARASRPARTSGESLRARAALYGARVSDSLDDGARETLRSGTDLPAFRGLLQQHPWLLEDAIALSRLPAWVTVADDATAGADPFDRFQGVSEGLDHVRTAGRVLDQAAMLALHDGHPEIALQRIMDGLDLVRAIMTAPTIAQIMHATALEQAILARVEEFLPRIPAVARGPGRPAIERLRAHLDATIPHRDLVEALVGEGELGLGMIESMESMTGSALGWMADLVPGLGFSARQERIAYLHAMAGLISEATRPFPQQAWPAGAPPGRRGAADMLIPAVGTLAGRSALAARHRAVLDLSIASLLGEVPPTMPADPLTGAPLRVERDDAALRIILSGATIDETLLTCPLDGRP